MRVLTLFARHGVLKYPEALTDWKGLVDRQIAARHDLLVVDNALPLGHHERDGCIEIIGSSNSSWEFSAWNDGVRHVDTRLESYDFIFLVTSAFRQFESDHLIGLSRELLCSLKGRGAATGHLDYYNVPLHFGAATLQSWIRSSMILIEPSALRNLGSLVSVKDRINLFSSDPASPFRRDAPIDALYRSFIIGWLTGEGTGQGVEWHSRFALTKDTLPFFEQKALAIINEQLLTHRLRSGGTPTIDLTWFTKQCRAGRPAETIPDWSVQLKQRENFKTEIGGS